ncbi:histone H1.1-like [Embiotoca jacksoni]|uniref:histone H1.1-like n=1 Tax=Embiotoca jacksoni TaxID=100190 RepID=UPI0037045DB2
MSKLASPRVSQLILSMVSQCKQTDGISIAELKRTLAAGGYRVNENDRRVTMVTQTLVNQPDRHNASKDNRCETSKTSKSAEAEHSIQKMPQSNKEATEKNHKDSQTKTQSTQTQTQDSQNSSQIVQTKKEETQSQKKIAKAS